MGDFVRIPPDSTGWNLYQKVTFDGLNKLIIVNPNVTTIDIKEDVYSSWKEWASLIDNSHWPQALRSIGGDPLVGDLYLGSTFFLLNGWKMRTWEGDHRLVVNGNIFTEDGSAVFVPTLNDYNTEISMTTSNIVNTVNVSSGNATVDNAAIASAVWNKLLTDITTTSSIGLLMKSMEKKIDDIQAIVESI